MHRRDPCLLACVNISRAPKAMDLSRHRTGALTSLSISQSKCVCVLCGLMCSWSGQRGEAPVVWRVPHTVVLWVKGQDVFIALSLMRCV